MIEQIDYLPQENGAIVYRCYGQGRFAAVPDQVNGCQVRGIGDHCFAPDMSVRVKSGALWRWDVRTGKACPVSQWQTEGQPEAICAERIEEISLPMGLREIGDYAFYNCYHLRELTLPFSLTSLGSGAFVAANHVKKIRFVPSADDREKLPLLFRDVVEELTYEIEMVVEDETGAPYLRLYYPEYYEDSVEDTPARLIQVSYEGTGFKYRQCFAGRQLDLKRYDEAFRVLRVQELTETALKLIFVRLSTPHELSQQARTQYLSYLKEHSRETIRKVLESADLNLLKMLEKEHFYTEEVLTDWLDTAAGAGHPEIAGYLMEVRRSLRPARRRRYEL